MSKTRKKIQLFLGDRRTFTMMICVLLSIFLWSLIRLSKNLQREFSIDIHLTNIPKDMFVNPLQKHQIKIIAEGKGYALLKYYAKDQRIMVDFDDLEHIDDKKYKLSKNIANKIKFDYLTNLKIQNTYSDTIIIDLERKYTKKVPVIVKLNANYQKEHQLTELIINPDSVEVQGVKKVIDTLNAIFISFSEKNKIGKSFEQTHRLENTEYMRFVQNKVEVKAIVDKVSEQVFLVPVQVLNIPKDSQIKIFPTEVTILCTGDLSIIKNIKPDDIIIEADYNSIQNNSLPLAIRTKLKRVKLSFLNDDKVEFVLYRVCNRIFFFCPK